jgi:hypothetical protein
MAAPGIPVPPTSLPKALSNPTEVRPSEVILIPLGDDGAPDLQTFGTPLRFQYFPESLTDSKAINYQQKEVPGGSLPLYQWVSSGERSIIFTAFFTSDTDLVADPQLAESLQSSTLGLRDRNVDIRSAVAWLRSFMLPRYVNGSTGGGGGSSVQGTAPTGNTGVGSGAQSSGVTYLTLPPRRVRLYIPNSGIGVAGGMMGAQEQQALPDSVTCVMTQCEVEWTAYFPSGCPRIASVQLGFAQVAQLGQRVLFPSADGMQSVVQGSPDRGRTRFYGYKLTNRRRNDSAAAPDSESGQTGGAVAQAQADSILRGGV